MRHVSQKKQLFGGHFHEDILLFFIWSFGAVSIFCHFFLANPPVFSLFVPLPCLFFLLACPLAGLGIRRNKAIARHREKTLLALTCLFCAYLSYLAFLSNNDEILSRIYWLFIAMAGTYFLTYKYSAFFLMVGFVGMGLVHLALPASTFAYPAWMYMAFVPFLTFVFYSFVSTSIMERRHSELREKSLREKHRGQTNILDSLNEIVAFVDNKGIFTHVNQAMADFFGKTKEEVIGRTIKEMLGPEQATRIAQEHTAMFKNKEPIRNGLRRIRLPGQNKDIWLRVNKTPFFDEKGQQSGVVFCGEDVTEEMAAKRKMVESEEGFRMIFENAPDGIGLISISNNSFVKVNPALAAMVGFSENELVGKSPVEIAHPDDRYSTLSLFSDAIKSNINKYSTEHRFLKKDGTSIVCRLSAHIVREDGRPKYLICLFQDVTEKKDNERRLKKYAVQLEESNQNLQEFAYAASHDLREPLRTVMSYTLLLKRHLNVDEHKPEVYEFMNFIMDASQRMDAQINALLQYSRVGRGELSANTVDLNHTLEVVKAGLDAQIRESNAIVGCDQLPPVMADQTQMAALFQNLLSNALKYQPAGQRPEVHVSFSEKGGMAILSVSDNGIGIAPKMCDRIFAVFSRLHTRDQYPGSGVGLAICRRIVKRHGGEIWLESEPGRGSTFYCSLPLAKSNENEGIQNRVGSLVHT